MTTLNDLLETHGACLDAREWAATQPDLATAWNACERADWMLWLVVKVCPRELVVLAAVDCAWTASEYWTEDTELACLWALDATERWALGKGDIEEVRAAAAAAAAAAYAAAVYAAAAAAAAAAVHAAD